ncbi:MAG: hypothetical protein LBP33_02655 [Candidatus Adiutrix sp.]|nr:hypothetical protein [Candidatus Adiutrix sp.]
MSLRLSLLSLVLLGLMLPAAALGQPGAFEIELHNEGEVLLTEVVMTPISRQDRSFEAETGEEIYGLQPVEDLDRRLTRPLDVAHGQTVRFRRPDADRLDLVFTYEGGALIFREVLFNYEQALTRIWLHRDRAGVPILDYDFDEENHLDARGRDSAWPFPPTLDSLPFGLGVSTLAQAREMGAGPTAEAGVLRSDFPFLGDRFDLKLTFDGPGPGSLLRRLDLSYSDHPEYEVLGVLSEELGRNGYRLLYAKTDRGALDLSKAAAEGAGPEQIDELYFNLIGEGYESFAYSVFVPEKMFEELTMTSGNRDGRPELARFEKEVVVGALESSTAEVKFHLAISSARDFKYEK